MARVIAPVPYSPKVLGFNNRWKGYRSIPSCDTIDDIEVYYPRYLNLPGYWFHKYSCYTVYLGIMKTVHRIFNKFKPDIIHAHMATADGYVGLLIKKKYGIPLVCSFRGDDINIYPFNSKMIYRLTKSVIEQADALVTVSNDLKNITASIANPAREIHVIHNGCDFTRKHENTIFMRERIKIGNDARIIIFIGRIEREKGIYELLESFINLSGEINDLHLVLIGEGPERLNIKDKVQMKNLEKRVHFLGNIPHVEVSDWLSASDVFALPTYYEGLPNALLEAMACGLPVVSTNVGGIPEAVSDGENGLLVEAKDIEGLTHSLRSILMNKDQARKMGLNGQECIKNKFSWSANADKLLNVYKSILTVNKKQFA